MSAWCKFKIERLSSDDGCFIVEADIAKELLGLQAVGAWDGLHIFPDAPATSGGHWQYPRMSAGWEPEGKGYVLQCYETSDSMSFVLSSSARLCEPEVYVELGGSTQELWPRQLFVPYHQARKAIRYFLDTGLQDPQFVWVGLSSFNRRAVPSRLRWRSNKT